MKNTNYNLKKIFQSIFPIPSPVINLETFSTTSDLFNQHNYYDWISLDFFYQTNKRVTDSYRVSKLNSSLKMALYFRRV